MDTEGGYLITATTYRYHINNIDFFPYHGNKISSCKSGALSPPVLNERVNANLVPLRDEILPDLQELILFFTSLLLHVRPQLQEPESPTVLMEVRLL